MTSCAACLVLGAGGLGIALFAKYTPIVEPKPGPMLLAPMIGVIDSCVLLPDAVQTSSLEKSCTASGKGSAAALVESTLAELQPNTQKYSRYPLGYTLPIPLLQLFHKANGKWAIEEARVQRLVRTIQDTNRPVILYLFSTHFSSHSSLEKELANDPHNLAQTQDGPLPQDIYYGAPIYNWTFASTDNEITRRRLEATQAILEATCKLDSDAIAKIRGITLLGELHHLFPKFQTGMGFDDPYRVTDYSETSARGFRKFLSQEYNRIEKLNRILKTDFTSFDEISPPSKDIRKEPLKRYVEHIDSFAHGSLPISGWAYIPRKNKEPIWAHIYRNGEFIGKTLINQGRQDVLEAMPQFQDANTGWRFDMNFRQLPHGIHQIKIFLEISPGQLTPLGERHIAIMDRKQHPPTLRPQKKLPDNIQPPRPIEGYIDFPKDNSSYYYNPLVPLWHKFRGQQIVDYLRFFNNTINQSCLSKKAHYTHQLIPFTNPSWDANKFAVDQSLKINSGLRLGVSLYGDATYGKNFFNWHRKNQQTAYGVTEFHPLKAMSPSDLQETLDLHSKKGADFVSFFLEPRWHGQLLERKHNELSIDPDNMHFGSSALYKSLAQVIGKQNKETP